MNMTQWFNGHVCPTRVGAYQRKVDQDNTVYAYWDGDLWHEWFPGEPTAELQTAPVDLNQSRFQWRGLADDPGSAEWEEGLNALANLEREIENAGHI